MAVAAYADSNIISPKAEAAHINDRSAVSVVCADDSSRISAGLLESSAFVSDESLPTCLSKDILRDEIPGAIEDDALRLQNIIMRLMIPEIQNAVDSYYSEYLNYPPQIEVYDTKTSSKITSITFNRDTNIYTVTVEVSPYLGPHNNIGIDKIILAVDGSGKVDIKDFEHLKSFELMPNEKSNIKKPLP